MKVLYVSGMYPNPTYPQKGIFCHEQVKALKQIGVDVDVIVPMTIYDKEYTTAVWDYEGVAIRYIRFFKLPGVCGYENIGRHFFHSLMRAHIDFSKYDVLHADAPLPAGDALMRISRKFDIPFVVHGHGLDVFSEVSYTGAKNCKKIVNTSLRTYQEADAIVGVSQKVLNEIAKKVDLGSHAYVVYNGVDIERFYPVKHASADVMTITSIGNLIPLKGHDYTIKAVRILVDQGITNIKLVIAGRGENEEKLKKLAHQLKLDEFVKFVGYVPYDDVVKLLQQSDIFVLPSWYEALGCVYLEAMACGVPAIGCYGNGIDEIITDGVNGFLVDGKNERQIAEKIKEYVQGDRKKVSLQALETVRESYSWISSAKNLERVYRKLKNDTSHNK